MKPLKDRLTKQANGQRNLKSEKNINYLHVVVEEIQKWLRGTGFGTHLRHLGHILCFKKMGSGGPCMGWGAHYTCNHLSQKNGMYLVQNVESLKGNS